SGRRRSAWTGGRPIPPSARRPAGAPPRPPVKGRASGRKKRSPRRSSPPTAAGPDGRPGARAERKRLGSGAKSEYGRKMIRENVTALQALERLREGNQRFASNVRSIDSMICRRDNLANGQRPVAIVLACSDSRSPAEMVFDQGLGDLFVIRVAGNVVAASQIG